MIIKIMKYWSLIGCITGRSYLFSFLQSKSYWNKRKIGDIFCDGLFCLQSTLDFVSYVAKDPGLGRACHVLECGGGLAEDVVTTIGQAFELRFKQYLKLQPQTVQLSDR